MTTTDGKSTQNHGLPVLRCDVCSRDPRDEGSPYLEFDVTDDDGRARAWRLRLVCESCRRNRPGDKTGGGPMGPGWQWQIGNYATRFLMGRAELNRVIERLEAVEPPKTVHMTSSTPEFTLCGARRRGVLAIPKANYATCPECRALIANLKG
jgi:hypothetical protein